MTALSERVPTSDEHPQRHGVDPTRGIRLWAPTCLSVAVGILVVAYSYRTSMQGGSPAQYYALFWVGMSTGLIPLVVVAARRGSSEPQRYCAILLLGLFTAVPKYLRNPIAPLYHDEFAHWREAVDVLADGRLYHPNTIIPIIEFFPGNSALTASIAQLTGLSAWSSGQLLVCLTHLLSLFAVYVLGRTLLESPRAGAIAAIVYALNPSALYFDTQYAYESVAIALFLWVLASGVLADAAQARRSRYGYIAAGLLCAAGCTVTHHLTTLALLAVLALLAITATFRTGATDRSSRVAPWWILLVGTGAIGAAWLIFVASPTIDYLTPYLGTSIGQLTDVVTSTGGNREVLVATAQPLPERLLTALAPVVIGIVFVIGLVIVRRHRRTHPSPIFAFVTVGMVYFASVPFVLVPSGAEGARRSWGFTYVALALILALVVVRARPARTPARRRWRVVAVGTVLAVLAIGNTGGGLNDPYRFPGPFLWGSDTRSYSAEARTIAEQLEHQFGRVRIVSDRYTSLALAAYGQHYLASPSEGFPVWELTQTNSDPDPALVGDMTFSRYVYLVVDIRMSEAPPFNGDNYGAGDPLAGVPTPLANLDRLDTVAWASRIMSTEHLRVYRLDLERITDPLQVQAGP